MKEITMHLKEVPPNYYIGFQEKIYEISKDKIYMVDQLTITNPKPFSTQKFFFRLPTEKQVYEALITEQLYEGILTDIHFTWDEIKFQSVYEYLYGKDTIKVIKEYINYKSKETVILAFGPEDNKEWQYEFQKYHI